MKIYKDDYKHFRECQKLTWFLSEKHYSLAKKLIEEKKILNFVELTNTKTSSKVDQSVTKINDLETLNFEQQEFGHDIPDDDFYPGEMIADGLETGKYAQKYFQQKYQTYNFETNPVIDQDLILQDEKYQVFFEPRFQYQDCITKCDILKRNGQGWDLIEVKAVTWVKEEHMWDLLYQYDILTKCGLRIVNVYIMYLNNNYLLQEKLDLIALFISNGSTWQKSPATKKSFSLYDSIQNEIVEHNLTQEYHKIKEILTITDIDEVYKFLTNKYCHENQKQFCFHIFTYFDPTNTIFQLYRLRKTKKALWFYQEDLLSLQDKRLLPFIVENKLHYRQYQVANLGEQIIDLSAFDKLQIELENYRYPVYMYDFETMKSAIPKFNNTKPYQQIVFQYSVHVLLNQDFDFQTDANIKHYQFLANGLEDPRIEVVKYLVHDLIKIHGLGTYVAYNKSFEKGILRNLMFEFKEHFVDLKAISDLTIDLQDFFKEFKVYKSDFAGSLSIKKTLPAFAPDFSYHDLPIRKGDMASEVFRRRVENNISLQNWETNFYQNMLNYCTRDTLAMVILFWHIKKLIKAEAERRYEES